MRKHSNRARLTILIKTERHSEKPSRFPVGSYSVTESVTVTSSVTDSEPLALPTNCYHFASDLLQQTLSKCFDRKDRLCQ